MAGVAMSVRFGRERIAEALRDNQLGEFVGMRAIFEPAMDYSSGIEHDVHAGWFLAGTIGYAEVDTDGSVYTTGVWFPDAVIGK